tara:strand:- start:2988 stop:4421 length:1434 start_codon:yes stop_codon:yes gene_type:complete
MAQMTGGQLSTNEFYTGSTTGSPAPQHGQRRRHNFGDRVYKLAPQETPFFAYLNAVGKFPTDDPVYRVLEDRAPTKWADRTFSIDCSSNAVAIEATEGDDWIQDGANDLALNSGASSELIVGMLVQAVLYGDTVTGDHASAEMPEQVTARITEVSTANNTIVLNTVSIGGNTNTSIDSGSITCQVIGTAFAEGTGAPDSFGYDIEDTFGYTQIFKTSAYMSNTAMATVMRGYASEWDRIWSMKLREHKVDIERAFLYNNKGIVGGLQYTDGMIGSILKSGATYNTANTALSYQSGKPFVRVVDTSVGAATGGVNEAIYDRWLQDFEVIFAPERGGADQKFCMASLPVVTYLNKLKGGFMDSSASSRFTYNLDFSSADGGMGHKVMKIDTVHGSLAVVRNPLLKGIGKSMMVGVDLDNVKYRPLVGNGVNRDTHIDTNVQTPDEDSRKDLILTEAGLEVCMPESHFLYQFVTNGTPIG